jgi:hypothetical protein
MGLVPFRNDDLDGHYGKVAKRVPGDPTPYPSAGLDLENVRRGRNP